MIILPRLGPINLDLDHCQYKVLFKWKIYLLDLGHKPFGGKGHSLARSLSLQLTLLTDDS
jgi:hypothetical protein